MGDVASITFRTTEVAVLEVTGNPEVAQLDKLVSTLESTLLTKTSTSIVFDLVAASSEAAEYIKTNWVKRLTGLDVVLGSSVLETKEVDGVLIAIWTVLKVSCPDHAKEDSKRLGELPKGREPRSMIVITDLLGVTYSTVPIQMQQELSAPVFVPGIVIHAASVVKMERNPIGFRLDVTRQKLLDGAMSSYNYPSTADALDVITTQIIPAWAEVKKVEAERANGVTN